MNGAVPGRNSGQSPKTGQSEARAKWLMPKPNESRPATGPRQACRNQPGNHFPARSSRFSFGKSGGSRCPGLSSRKGKAVGPALRYAPPVPAGLKSCPFKTTSFPAACSSRSPAGRAVPSLCRRHRPWRSCGDAIRSPSGEKSLGRRPARYRTFRRPLRGPYELARRCPAPSFPSGPPVPTPAGSQEQSAMPHWTATCSTAHPQRRNSHIFA